MDIRFNRIEKEKTTIVQYNKTRKSYRQIPIIRTVKGTKINPHVLRKSFKTVLRKVGIENLRFHDLRHTFATRLVQAGVELYKISELLDHKDIKLTQRYAHH